MAPVSKASSGRKADAATKAAKRAANRAAHEAEKAVAKAAAQVAVARVAPLDRPLSAWTADEKARVWDAVLDGIRRGASYRAACRAQGVDAAYYWRAWVQKGHEGELDEAREAQGEVWVARVAKRVRDLDAVPAPELTSELIQRARVGIETEKWLAGITAPKRYGPKMQIDQRVTRISVELRDESGVQWRLGGDDYTVGDAA